jgi:hypothetical protein
MTFFYNYIITTWVHIDKRRKERKDQLEKMEEDKVEDKLLKMEISKAEISMALHQSLHITMWGSNMALMILHTQIAIT